MSASPSPADERSGRAGLYLHVPFCSAVCPYCDFAVKVAAAGERDAYVDALLAEADLARDEVAGWRFDTVYLGGGTPSILPADELARLVEGLRERLPIEADAALHLEANPEDVDAASVAAWRGLGVAFLSLGVQSFDDEALTILGRRHSGREARRAVEQTLAAGFPTVSVDLIYGLPGDDTDRWRRDLDVAVALAPPHLSCYALEVHERTPFGKRAARGDAVAAPDDAQADLFLETHAVLAAAGWQAYEVSNFARGGHRSRHNRKYWEGAPYLGLGPSACSFDGDRRRWWNERAFPAWRRRLASRERPIAGDETLTDVDLALETLMLRLRTPDGLDLDAFRRRHGIDLASRNPTLLSRAVADGLLLLDGSSLRPTSRGLAVADGLAASFDFGDRRAERPV